MPKIDNSVFYHHNYEARFLNENNSADHRMSSDIYPAPGQPSITAEECETLQMCDRLSVLRRKPLRGVIYAYVVTDAVEKCEICVERRTDVLPVVSERDICP